MWTRSSRTNKPDNSTDQSPYRKADSSLARQEICLVYGSWMFIAVFTKARHLPVSWAKLIQSRDQSYSLTIILKLCSHLHLGFPSLFPSGCVNIDSSKHFFRTVPFQCGWFLETEFKFFSYTSWIVTTVDTERIISKDNRVINLTSFPFLLTPSELSRTVKLLYSTWKVLCSNLDRDTDCTFVPVHIMKAYRGRRSIAPLTSILNTGEWSP